MDANIVVTQVSSAAVVVYVIQRLKTAPWFTWIQNDSQVWIKRGASLVAALGVHTGISYVWNAAPGNAGAHVLAITVPPLTVIAIGVWHWFNQYVLQELVYQATTNKGVAAKVG